MATVACRCGEVVVRFSTEKPVHGWECCCVDCYDKNKFYWPAGTPLPAGVSAQHGEGNPLDLRYFENRLCVETGQNSLAFSRLREGARSTNMIAACCATLLCVDHPHYERKLVLMFPDFLALAAELPPNCARVFAGDWPEDRLKALPGNKGNFFFEAGGAIRLEPEGHEGGLAAMSNFRMLVGRDMELREGETTFQRLLEDAGGDVACLGLPENPNSLSVRKAKAAPPTEVTG